MDLPTGSAYEESPTVEWLNTESAMDEETLSTSHKRASEKVRGSPPDELQETRHGAMNAMNTFPVKGATSTASSSGDVFEEEIAPTKVLKEHCSAIYLYMVR